MPKKTKNLIKTISDRKKKQLDFLDDNKDYNFSVTLANIVNTPQFILLSLVIPITYYFLVKKYTDNILKNPNCTCVLEEYITDIKKNTLYLIGFQILVTVLKLFNAPQLIIGIVSIIGLFYLISVFLNWRKIIKNIDENNCECADTLIKNVISFISWTQIIMISLGPILAIIFLLMYFIAFVSLLFIAK